MFNIFKKILPIIIAGIITAGFVLAGNPLYWIDNINQIPRTDNVSDIGSSLKRVQDFYSYDAFLSGNLQVGIVATIDSTGFSFNNGTIKPSNTSTNVLTLTARTSVGSITFSGGGIDNMTTSGTYTGTSTINYRIQIDGTGTPDTFKISVNNGSSWATEGVPMTGSAQSVGSGGLYVTFATTIGHTIGTYWNFTATPYTGTFLQIEDMAGNDKIRVDSQGRMGIGSAVTSVTYPLEINGVDYTYALWIDNAGMVIDADNEYVYFGEAQDSYIGFNNTSLNIVANDLTSSDDIVFSSDKFEHSSGTFNFNDDNLITTGNFRIGTSATWDSSGLNIGTGTLTMGSFTSNAATIGSLYTSIIENPALNQSYRTQSYVPIVTADALETPFYFERATAPLTTPTSDATGDALHPDVVYIPGGWNGYTYWMVMTPFANANVDLENPEILVSNDGDTWIVPPGGTNPISPHPAEAGRINHDPTIMFDKGIMYVYWGEYMIGDGDLIRMKYSSDGITWSTIATVLDAGGTQEESLSSPIVRNINGTYYLWAVNTYPAATVVSRYSSTSPSGTFSGGTACTLTTGVIYPFHINILWDGDAYYMIFKRDGSGELYFGRSYDGLLWDINGVEVKAGGGVSDWDEANYQSALIKRPGMGYFDVFYSAYDDATPDLHRIGRGKLFWAEHGNGNLIGYMDTVGLRYITALNSPLRIKGDESNSQFLEIWANTATTTATYDPRILFRTGTSVTTRAMIGIDLDDSYKLKISDSSGIASPTLTVNFDSGITIGAGLATVDYNLTFDGETTDGVLTWMEDEDYLKFSDHIMLPDSIRSYFGTGSAASPDAFIQYTGTNWDFDIQQTTSAIRFNPSNLDTDFSIGTATSDYTFFVDAGAYKVGIGTNAPTSLIDVQGEVPMLKIMDIHKTNNYIKMGVINDGAGSYYPGIWFSQATPGVTNYFVLEETPAGSVIFNAPSTKLVYFRIANVTKLTLNANDAMWGSGAAGIDYTMSWNGETNDGLLTWMEDEDLFRFNDAIQLLDNEALNIGTGSAASGDAMFYYDSNDLWFDLSYAATSGAGFSDFAFKFQDSVDGSEIQFWRKNGVGVGSLNSSGSLYLAGLSGTSTLAATSGVSFLAGIENDGLNAYNKIDSENGVPPLVDCNENSEDGNMIKDYLNDRLYICNYLSGRGWDYISLTD